MQVSSLNGFEKAALDFLTRGEDERLQVLRKQLGKLQVKERDFTGVGFFSELEVAEPSPSLAIKKNLVIGDVYAEIEEMEHGVGFLLFVEDGRMKTLECFSYDEQLPVNAKIKRLYYMKPDNRGSLTETASRDIAFALGDKTL